MVAEGPTAPGRTGRERAAPATAQAGRRPDLRAAFRSLSRFLSGRRAFAAIAGTAIASSLCEAGALVLITLAATGLAREASRSELAGWELTQPQMLVGAGVLLLARLGLVWLNVRLSARLSARGLAAARRQLLEAFVASRWERQSLQPSGQLFDLLATRADLVGALVSVLSGMVVAGANLTILALLSMALQPLAVLGLALVGGVLAWALRPFNVRTRRASGELMVASEAFLEAATDLSHNHRELAAYGAGPAFVRSTDDHQGAVVAAYTRTRTLTAFLPQVYQTLGMGLAVVGLAVAAAAHSDDVAVLGAVVLLLLRAVSYGQQLMSSTQAVNERLPYMDSLISVIDDLRSHHHAVGAERPARLGRIELRDVGYRYSSTAPQAALRDIDLVVDEGQMVGIVGPSGSGKSTLLQVMAGLRQPTSGTVVVADVDLDRLDPAWWHRRVALVPQDASILSGTVAENIDLFRGLPRATLEGAAARAQMTPDVARIGGLDAALSRHRTGLSGGQLQRLSIARALAGDPALLLLDEPTSALDVGTEQRLGAVLQELRGTVTMVIVAHRLSTVAACDRILVVEGGAIVADGPPGLVLEEFGRRAVDRWELVEEAT